MANINRINTWLTCERADDDDTWWGCPAVIGSNNIWKIEDFKFAVQIQRGGYLPGYNFKPITFEEAQAKNYQIHYEVEGPC